VLLNEDYGFPGKGAGAGLDRAQEERADFVQDGLPARQPGPDWSCETLTVEDIFTYRRTDTRPGDRCGTTR
jgi:hypothetical protein